MKTSRLMNRPEDYQKIGVKPSVIEPWEDGRRDNCRLGAFEWWYFDTILDDGTKAVITYAPKPSERVFEEGEMPFTYLEITFPDGTQEIQRESDLIYEMVYAGKTYKVFD